MKKELLFCLSCIMLCLSCNQSGILEDTYAISGEASTKNVENLKPRIKGFVLRGDGDNSVGKRNFFDDPNTSDYNFGSYVDAIIVQAEWASLQLTQSSGITENNIIDQALAALRKWNAANPENKLSLKIRVFAGIHSPAWVSDVTGGCMVYYKHGAHGILPFFWNKAKFRPLWENFQLKLAERYDNDPLVREIAISGAMTHNAETMWRNPGDDKERPDNKTNIQVLRENGLTVVKDKSALKWQVNAAANAWKKTRLGMALNMWKDYENNWVSEPRFVDELISHCLNTCGSQVILGNNSIGLSDVETDDSNDPSDVLYYLKKANGDKNAHIYVQTETVADDIHRAINYAANNLAAKMAELPKLKSMDKYQIDYLKKLPMQRARQNLKK